VLSLVVVASVALAVSLWKALVSIWLSFSDMGSSSDRQQVHQSLAQAVPAVVGQLQVAATQIANAGPPPCELDCQPTERHGLISWKNISQAKMAVKDHWLT
jgi:hypothetical protein